MTWFRLIFDLDPPDTGDRGGDDAQPGRERVLPGRPGQRHPTGECGGGEVRGGAEGSLPGQDCPGQVVLRQQSRPHEVSSQTQSSGQRKQKIQNADETQFEDSFDTKLAFSRLKKYIKKQGNPSKRESFESL